MSIKLVFGKWATFDFDFLSKIHHCETKRHFLSVLTSLFLTYSWIFSSLFHYSPRFHYFSNSICWLPTYDRKVLWVILDKSVRGTTALLLLYIFYRVFYHPDLQAKHCTDCILYKSKVTKNRLVGPRTQHRLTRSDTISPGIEIASFTPGFFQENGLTTPDTLNDALLGASVLNKGDKRL